MPDPTNNALKQKTIGILGGGQLGRMLAMAAGRMGFRSIIVDPDPNCPAAQFCNKHINANYDDINALDQLAEECFVTTYEFENIPLNSARRLEETSQIHPGSKALEISQDRLNEKSFLQSIGLQTAAFVPIEKFEQIEQALIEVGPSAILKTRRLGYDGKGQIRINKSNLLQQSEEIKAQLSQNCILEQMVPFDCEISVIGTRSPDGKTSCFEPARNVHEQGILATSTVPCQCSEEIVDQAKYQTIRLMNELDYVGTIGVEFFVTNEGSLLVNEFAPRVHNSGHWTEAACLISQFEQHIRAITGNALGSTERHSDCVMENLIGERINELPDLMKQSDKLVHDYGKLETRAGRKMGHVTTLIKR